MCVCVCVHALLSHFIVVYIALTTSRATSNLGYHPFIHISCYYLVLWPLVKGACPLFSPLVVEVALINFCVDFWKEHQSLYRCSYAL